MVKLEFKSPQQQEQFNNRFNAHLEKFKNIGLPDAITTPLKNVYMRDFIKYDKEDKQDKEINNLFNSVSKLKQDIDNLAKQKGLESKFKMIDEWEKEPKKFNLEVGEYGFPHAQLSNSLSLGYESTLALIGRLEEAREKLLKTFKSYSVEYPEDSEDFVVQNIAKFNELAQKIYDFKWKLDADAQKRFVTSDPDKLVAEKDVDIILDKKYQEAMSALFEKMMKDTPLVSMPHILSSIPKSNWNNPEFNPALLDKLKALVDLKNEVAENYKKFQETQKLFRGQMYLDSQFAAINELKTTINQNIHTILSKDSDFSKFMNHFNFTFNLTRKKPDSEELEVLFSVPFPTDELVVPGQNLINIFLNNIESMKTFEIDRKYNSMLRQVEAITTNIQVERKRAFIKDALVDNLTSFSKKCLNSVASMYHENISSALNDPEFSETLKKEIDNQMKQVFESKIFGSHNTTLKDYFDVKFSKVNLNELPDLNEEMNQIVNSSQVRIMEQLSKVTIDSMYDHYLYTEKENPFSEIAKKVEKMRTKEPKETVFAWLVNEYLKNKKIPDDIPKEIPKDIHSELMMTLIQSPVDFKPAPKQKEELKLPKWTQAEPLEVIAKIKECLSNANKKDNLQQAALGVIALVEKNPDIESSFDLMLGKPLADNKDALIKKIKEIKPEIQLPYLTGQESSFEAKPVVEKQEVVKMPIEEKQIEEPPKKNIPPLKPPQDIVKPPVQEKKLAPPPNLQPPKQISNEPQIKPSEKMKALNVQKDQESWEDTSTPDLLEKLSEFVTQKNIDEMAKAVVYLLKKNEIGAPTIAAQVLDYLGDQNFLTKVDKLAKTLNVGTPDLFKPGKKSDIF